MKKASELTEAEMAAKLVKGVEEDMQADSDMISGPTPTQRLLQNRGKTHGSYDCHARASMRLRRAIEEALYESKPDIQNGGRAVVTDGQLNDVMSHTLEQICDKLGRIIAGDPNFPDHWNDIAGYAKLVADRL